MSTKSLRIIKKPRTTILPDIPINFPSFKNLHLELLEIKAKIKQGLPLIARTKPKLNSINTSKNSVNDVELINENIEPEETEKKPKSKGKSDDDIIPKKSKQKESIVIPTSIKSKSKKHNKSSKKNKKSSKKRKKDVLVMELGESDEEEEAEDEEEAEAEDEDEDEAEDEDEDEEEAEDEEVDEGEAEEVEEEEEGEGIDIYAGLSPEERIIKEKEEYIWRFRILKKQYGRNPSIPIPEWNEHSDLNNMKSSYDRTIRELYLDDAVESYRTYLMGGWIVMEYLCTQVLSIDLTGFTVQQMRMMYKYDKMLIELGEKSYTRWGMDFPVEIRLIGFILFQACIFYLGKIIADKMGDSVAELFKGFTGQPPNQTPARNNGAPADNGNAGAEGEAKMRGPRLKAEDIRKRKQEEGS